ncbi:MAG: hypothetical protein ABIR79_16330 [Candidatus Binatia bacterium]
MTAAPAFDEILLGIGVIEGRPLPNGGRTSTPLVLRNDGTGWTSFPVRVPVGAFLSGVGFSTPEVAWLYGGRNESFDGVLLRSDDAGRTWRDVSSILPSDCQAVADLAFADAQVGYLVSHGYYATAFFVTHDGGQRWQRMETAPEVFPVSNLAAGIRDGAVEAVLSGGELSVVRLDDPSVPPVALTPPGDIRMSGANGCATVASRGWIAAAASLRRHDAVHTRAAIFSSAAPGAPWIEQSVASTTPYPQLRAIDVRDAENGVAVGSASTVAGEAMVPYAIVTTADGLSWQEAPITGLSEGWAVVDALRTRGEGAWAIATRYTSTTESALLRSDDGGRSWHLDVAPLVGNVGVFDLARNSAVH